MNEKLYPRGGGKGTGAVLARLSASLIDDVVPNHFSKKDGSDLDASALGVDALACVALPIAAPEASALSVKA